MTDTVSPCSSTFDDTPHRDGRHENSLAVLCQRFCEIYKDAQDPINIDIAAKELGKKKRFLENAVT
jgi:hypothetical protein